MAETTATIDWDQIDVDEEMSEADHKKAENIAVQNPVGKFLCTIKGSDAIQKDFTNYSCYAAKLKMRIDDVIEIEKPIFDNDGKPVMRNGEQLMKRQPVEGKEKESLNALYGGRFQFDEINMYHPKEKEAMKNRRNFVGKKIGIINDDTTKITGKMWAKDVLERQVIITTEWNTWKDKDTGEIKKNVKVGFSGYESVAEHQQQKQDEIDFSNI